MTPNPHSRRFDPRWLSTPLKTDGEELFGAPDADLRSAAEESRNDSALRDFDEALEQIVSDECRVCPLCGVIVDRDGTVVNPEPSGPRLATILKGRVR
jgi:hypothetical protein